MKPSGIFWGSFLVFLGIFFLMSNFELLNFESNYIFKFWPVILIIWGAALLKIPLMVKGILAGLSGLLVALLLISAVNYKWNIFDFDNCENIAVEIFHDALEEKKYECFLQEDTYLPMMYMSDAIKATIELMEAPSEKIKIRTSYNISGMSFSPKEIAAEIKKHIPDFSISYKPDYRQQIANSWPQSIDDSVARNDWGWKEEFDLAKMTKDMLENLK